MGREGSLFAGIQGEWGLFPGTCPQERPLAGRLERVVFPAGKAQKQALFEGFFPLTLVLDSFS